MNAGGKKGTVEKESPVIGATRRGGFYFSNVGVRGNGRVVRRKNRDDTMAEESRRQETREEKE